VPSSLDADLATLFIPVSNGLSWVRSAGRLSPGESAAVIGVGQHGLACVAAARRCGSGTLVAVGRAGDQARLDAAVKLGADVIVDADREDWVAPVLAATDGLGADLLVDTAPGATDILAGAARRGAVRRGAARRGRTGARPGQPVPAPRRDRLRARGRERLGLLALPRVESYRGLIFASFNPGVPPLAEHLGPGVMGYIDRFLDQCLGLPLVAHRQAHRIAMDANWKLQRRTAWTATTPASPTGPSSTSCSGAPDRACATPAACRRPPRGRSATVTARSIPRPPRASRW
jgi:hypothetical protein